MAEKGVVKTNGFEMEYFKFGNGDRILVILPGLSIQSVMGAKDAVEEGFQITKDDFTTYVFDRKKTLPDDYSIYDMADDTAAAIKELGFESVYVIGASQGGMIALALAVRYPGLVRKAVLCSTSSHVRPSQSGVILKWIELAQKKMKYELYQEYAKQIYPDYVYEQYKDYYADISKAVTDEELERFVILARSIPEFNITDELKKIECPVLALGAFDDSVLDSDATMEIAENLDHRPDFALYMYTGYGHAAFDTAPDYRERVYDFLMK